MNNKIQFPPKSKHEHPELKNTNEIIEGSKSSGQKAADIVAAIVGSWKFIIIQSTILVFWVIFNITGYVMHWDPYPFILMNLVLSLQAAYTAPVIMMSQNRQAERDRIEAHYDYLINVKAEEEIRLILEHLETQSIVLTDICQKIDLQNWK